MLIKRPKSRTGEAKGRAAEAREERTARFQEVRRIGRPPGARNKLSEAFIGDLQEIWEVSGPAILRQMLAKEPSKLAELVARLIPREFQVSVETKTPGNLDAGEWRVLVDLVKLIKSSAPEGGQALPSELVPALEETVRAHFARPIDTTR